MGDPRVANSIRVLVVDDDMTSATVIRDQLIAQEYDVETLDDARDAYEQIMDPDNGHYDLIILDVNLPGLDGVTLAKRLRKHGNHVPVLFVSGGIDPAIRLSITGMGPTASFLEKGWDNEMFLATCTELLARNHLASQVAKVDTKLDELTLFFKERMPTTEDIASVMDQKLEDHCPMAHEPILRLVGENTESLQSCEDRDEQVLEDQAQICREHRERVAAEIQKETSIPSLVTRARSDSLVKIIMTLLVSLCTVYVGFTGYTYVLADTATRSVAKQEADLERIFEGVGVRMRTQEAQMTRIEQNLSQIASRMESIPNLRTPTGEGGDS